jgi:uncharacterized iron-regulated protein
MNGRTRRKIAVYHRARQRHGRMPASNNAVIYRTMRTRTDLILGAGAFLVFLGNASAAYAQHKPVRPASTATCLSPAQWYTLADGEPRPVPARDLLPHIARRDVVLLGEQHDDASHHQWQLQTLAALHLLHPQMVIGFESFPRRVQPALDRWIAGELTVKQFLEQTEWEKVWNFPPELYLPLFQFARVNRIPIIALNVERSLTEAIRKKGWEAVPAEQKEGLSRPAPASEAYLDVLFEVFKEHSRPAQKSPALDKSDPAFRFFVESQITWDRAMAEALARQINTSSEVRRSLIVGVMGSGHVRDGNGVLHQLRDLGVSNVGTLLPVNARLDCTRIKRGLADAVFALPDIPRDKAPAPRLGIRLEETEGEARLAEVLPGTLAEKTGLQRGDRIVSIAGEPVTKMSTVVAAVRAQPAGTWLPLQINRNGQMLEFVVKFPRQ